MSVLPGDPLSLVGFVLIVGTLAVLVFSDWPRAYLLGVSCLVLFGLQFVAPRGLSELVFTPAGFLEGEWWTIVTYAFLHGGLIHIIGNLFILLTAGPALEDRVGPWWFLAIYAAGAVVAAGTGAALAYGGDPGTGISLPSPETGMVGASGAIFAVLTAFAVRHPQDKLPIPIILVIWLPSMIVLFIFLAFNVALIFLSTGVAWYGHFGGFLAGMAIGLLPLSALEDAGAEQLDVGTLRSLPSSRRGEEAVERLEELEPGEEDVASAWLDVLAEDAACPVCEASLERDGLGLRCPQGHSLEAGSSAASGG